MRSPRAPHPGALPELEASLSAILIQLDAFDEMAQELGEETAARLIGQVPARCAELLPTEVTLCAQEPGVFLALGLLNEAEATVLAERLKVQFLQRPFAAEAKMLTITASLGVAAKSDASEPREQWLQRVRGALQKAIARGGNRVEVAALRRRDLPITSNAPDDSQPARKLMPHQGLKPPRAPRSMAPVESSHVFDAETVGQLRELADDPAFLEELYDSYLASAEQSLAHLMRVDDPEAQRRAAHLLKGSSMNVGARAVAAACEELEHSLRAQGESVDVPAWVQVIEHELGRVRAAWTTTFGPGC